LGETAGAAAAVNGDVLAEGAAGANFDAAVDAGVKAEVLGWGADDGSAADFTVGTKSDAADELAVGEKAAARADAGGAFDDDVGANLGGWVDLSGGVNEGGGMEHESGEG
jgi:hypothetical protein